MRKMTKILDLFNLKLTRKLKFPFDSLKKTLCKGEMSPAFSPFPTMCLKPCFFSDVESWNCVVKD